MVERGRLVGRKKIGGREKEPYKNPYMGLHDKDSC